MVFLFNILMRNVLRIEIKITNKFVTFFLKIITVQRCQSRNNYTRCRQRNLENFESFDQNASMNSGTLKENLIYNESKIEKTKKFPLRLYVQMSLRWDDLAVAPDWNEAPGCGGTDMRSQFSKPLEALSGQRCNELIYYVGTKLRIEACKTLIHLNNYFNFHDNLSSKQRPLRLCVFPFGHPYTQYSKIIVQME